MAKLKEIVIDADHPAQLARFWAQVADGYAVRAYDADEIARLAGLGLTPETDPTVMVDGPGPTLCFHTRSGPRPFRNRIHLDLSSPDRTKEVERVLALGATFWRSGRRSGGRRTITRRCATPRATRSASSMRDTRPLTRRFAPPSPRRGEGRPTAASTTRLPPLLRPRPVAACRRGSAPPACGAPGFRRVW